MIAILFICIWLLLKDILYYWSATEESEMVQGSMKQISIQKIFWTPSFISFKLWLYFVVLQEFVFLPLYCCWKRAAILKPVLVLSFYLVIPKAYTIARRFRQSLIAIFQSLCCIISVYAPRLLHLRWISLQCLKKHSYF